MGILAIGWRAKIFAGVRPIECDAYANAILYAQLTINEHTLALVL